MVADFYGPLHGCKSFINPPLRCVKLYFPKLRINFNFGEKY